MTRQPQVDMDSTSHQAEVACGERFQFGANWAGFLHKLDDRRIALAERSLQAMLRTDTLVGKRFLDAGSGSGLLSLAARRLGASVHSFDFDPQSVQCTQELRRRYFPDDPDWVVESGSVLDPVYLRHLGRFDVVYSWGVLHHTGAMWEAMENMAPLVDEAGRLCIAIYNDQGWRSRIWLAIKRVYNRLPVGMRWLVLGPAMMRLWGPRMLLDAARGQPFHTWRHYADKSARGMDAWRDVLDWVGGLPFEVASPDAVFEFHRQRGFVLDQLATVGGRLGCNEFVFKRSC